MWGTRKKGMIGSPLVVVPPPAVWQWHGGERSSMVVRVSLRGEGGSPP